jgi:hypothetical protein
LISKAPTWPHEVTAGGAEKTDEGDEVTAGDAWTGLEIEPIVIVFGGVSDILVSAPFDD